MRGSACVTGCPAPPALSPHNECRSTRYGKGEDAKHKMIDTEIDLRAGLLDSLTSYRKEQEEKALAYVSEQAGKIVAGEQMLATRQSGHEADRKAVSDDTAKVEADLAKVEAEVAEGTAPEQARKKEQQQ